MRVVVPFAPERPKTRLAPVLDADERAAFARAMLDDVLDALDALDARETRPESDARDTVASDASKGECAVAVDPVVLSTAPIECPVPVTVDDRPLTDAVNARLPSSDDRATASDPVDPVAVVMADLALATPDALARLFAPDADVVLAPGRGGGTNALVSRHPGFRVDYHGASIRDHRRIAAEAGLDPATVDSFRLATDVDEPADLVEVLLHGEGAAAAWLDDAGFELATTDGRVEVRRRSD